MALEEKILAVAGGPHPAAVATIDNGLPVVRFMVLFGFEDMTFVGGTPVTTQKVTQLRKNPAASLAIWSGRQYSDPYVRIRATGAVHEDIATKRKYWNPMFEEYFKSVDNPGFVVLKFTAEEIEYMDPAKGEAGHELWKRK